jgi:hypothetical protein
MTTNNLTLAGAPRRAGVAVVVSLTIVLSGCSAEAPVEAVEPAADEVETYMVGDIEVRTDGLAARDDAYRADEIVFELAPGEGIEYKYRLEQDDTMVYSWESSGPVRTEMHAEADGQAEGTAEFFEVIESSNAGHGTFTAPFPGIHGWYWLNLNEEAGITLTLRSSGYYSYSMQFREGSRRRYEPGRITEPAESE